ncbi:MAG: protein-methionine-sulfoxide reductase catalytic subunit MsrP [Leptolyngbya sp. SIO4C1]|nr:protein-methionine-sulfoxide reductase catalytic subunit MsrP [Leptolyngbya sp. SIO4C1]
MVFSKLPPDWQLPETLVTPEAAFFNRRRFMKTLIGAGVGASLAGCRRPLTSKGLAELKSTYGQPIKSVVENPAFANLDRPVTEQRFASRFNNYYEFGMTKNIWPNAQKLPTEDWKVEVTGLVKNPKTYDRDDLLSAFPLEERVYRFRCVEAWAMVVPWIGFPMRRLIEAVEPTAAAKFVRFQSFYDPKITEGPTVSFSNLPWPYQEGLRLEEMANELAFFAVGIYGRTLPKQHGAPIRMVLPWKYGFKGAKSIVKIEFLAEQPATFWNTISPNEYKFEANVEPDVPHPRWSQKTERIVGEGNNWDWERRPTLLYNGYGDYVASLYS